MRLSTALFCLVATVIAFAAFATATADPAVVVEVLHTTVSTDGSSNKIGFFGQFNSGEFINKTNVYAQLTTGALPEGFTATNVTLVFRRHHCNCWVQESFFIPNKAEFTALPFTALIEDDSMTFMGYIHYTTTTTEVALSEVDFTLTFSVTEDGKTTPHALTSSLHLGRKSFGHVLAVSGPRQEVFTPELNAAETPVRPQVMFSDYQLDAVRTALPSFFEFSPIGRFQFRLNKKENEDQVVVCSLNGVELKGVVTGTEFETRATFALDKDLSPDFAQSGFFSFFCSGIDAALFPTNAISYYKYDLAFYSFEFLNAEKKSVGIGAYAAYNNVPDHIPTQFGISESYQDDDVVFCKYDLSYQPTDYVPSDKTDPTKTHSTGKDRAAFHFANLQEDKIMGIKANSTIRVDVAPTRYSEKYALNIPKNATLIENVDAKVLSAVDVEFSTKRFANLTNGISFSTFIDISDATIENRAGIQCAMVLTHPNGDADWEGSGVYSTTALPPILPAAAKTFKTEFELVTEKATFNTTFVGIKITAQELVTAVGLTVPAQNWIFSGNYTTCAITIANTAIPLIPTTDSADDERTVTMTFAISEETAKTILPDSDIFVKCGDVKLVPMSPSFEFVHETTIVRGLIKTDKATYSSSTILGLYPSKRWVTIIFMIFISIMIVSAALMLICFTRCIFLTCTKKAETTEDGEALLLNNGYSLE